MQSLSPQSSQDVVWVPSHCQSTLVVVIVVTDVLKTAQTPTPIHRPMHQPIRRSDRLKGALRLGTRALIEALPGGEVAIALWDGWRYPGRSR